MHLMKHTQFERMHLRVDVGLLCRLLKAAAEALGLHAGAGLHGQAPGDIRRRMRELSMLVHPDKCSLAIAEEVRPHTLQSLRNTVCIHACSVVIPVPSRDTEGVRAHFLISQA